MPTFPRARRIPFTGNHLPSPDAGFLAAAEGSFRFILVTYQIDRGKFPHRGDSAWNRAANLP